MKISVIYSIKFNQLSVEISVEIDYILERVFSQLQKLYRFYLSDSTFHVSHFFHFIYFCRFLRAKLSNLMKTNQL